MKKLILWALALILLVVSCARSPIPTPVHPTPTSTEEPAGPAGWIAFISDRDGDWEIFIIRADGSEQLQLTNNSAEDWYLSRSPDGQWIAFNSDRDGDTEIFIMRADGSEQTQLTNNSAEDAGPVWSPDGQWIAFVSNRDGDSKTFIMRPDGSEQAPATNYDHLNWGHYESRSPDGQWHAFASGRGDFGDHEIFIARTDDVGALERIGLTNNSVEERHPVWSRNGQWIAFVSDRDGDWEIFIMRPERGSEQIQLTHNSANDAEPSWAPAGWNP